MYPLRPFARCQSNGIEEQVSMGARYFDLRVRFDGYGSPYFAHGLVEYSGNVFEVLRYLSSDAGGCYVRVLLETMREADAEQRLYFDCFMRHCLLQYPNLRFRFGYKTPFKTIKSQWSGMAFVEVARWIHRWWELLLTPKWFACEQRSKIEELEKSGYRGIVAMDFLEKMKDN